MTDTNTRIYIANLGKYNEGELVGDWIKLPFTEEDYENLLVKIKLGRMVDGEYKHGVEIDGSIYEEYAIPDWETDIEGFEIGEYDNPEDLSVLIEQVEDLDEWQIKTLSAAMEYFGYKLEDIIDHVDDFILYEHITTDTEYGYHLIDEGCFEIDDNNPLCNYIDYDKLGRECLMDLNGGFTEYGLIEEMR